MKLGLKSHCTRRNLLRRSADLEIGCTRNQLEIKKAAEHREELQKQMENTRLEAQTEIQKQQNETNPRGRARSARFLGAPPKAAPCCFYYFRLLSLFLLLAWHVALFVDLGPWALERSDLTQSVGSGGRQPPGSLLFFPQTVFDCRGSDGLGFKGGLGGFGALPVSILHCKNQWFVTPTFKQPS